MDGLTIVAAAILIGIAAVALYLHDVAEVRSKHWLRDLQQRRALDRIHEAGRQRRG
jgi:hypothetical protein